MKTFPNLKSVAIIAIVLTTVFAVSCSKDEVFVPASEQNYELKSAGKALPPGESSIAEIAIDAGFSELVGALSYVDEAIEPSPGLVNLFLNGTDQYTVFAPTNDAFIALYGALGVGGITDLHPELVLNVLLYHVTEGRRAANSVVPKMGTRTIETLLGETFLVNPDLSIQAIGNTANIVPDFANISASNGIIHVIDAVILPIE